MAKADLETLNEEKIALKKQVAELGTQVNDLTAQLEATNESLAATERRLTEAGIKRK